MSLAVTELINRPSLQLHALESVVVVRLVHTLSPDDIDTFREALVRYREIHPRLLVLAIVSRLDQKLSGEARAKVQQLTKVFRTEVTAAAVVWQNTSPLFAIARLALTAYSFLMMSPLRMFDTSAPALAWLMRFKAQHPSIAEVDQQLLDRLMPVLDA